MTWAGGFILVLLFPQFLSIPEININQIIDVDIENEVFPRAPVESCGKQETVNLSHLKLSTIPTHMIQSNQIRHVDLSFNDIMEIPNNFFRNLPNLDCLNLTSNKYPPKSLFSGSYSNSLKTLVLDRSSDESYYKPCSMTGYFPNLETLHINDVAKCFPDESFESKLPRLTTLYMMNYSSIEGVSYWKIPSTVRHLHLEGNTFRTIDQSSGARLQSLYLDRSSYSRGLYIPMRATHLQILSMRHCDLHDYAIGYGFDYPLYDLRLLDLSHNNIENLPEKLLEQVSNLEGLVLSNNSITKIPDVQSLTQLRGLVLSHNKIEQVPDMTSDSLKMLSLRGNNITAIYNTTFEGLPALEILDLSENRLTSMPIGWAQNLENLVSLSLKSNFFTRLADMSLMTATSNLRHLFIKGNPIEKIVEEDFRLVPKNCTIHLPIFGETRG